MSHRAECTPYPRAGCSTTPRAECTPYPEQGVVPHPEQGVLPHPEQGVLPHPERSVHRTPSRVYYHTSSRVYYHTPSRVYYRTPNGGYTAPRARYICPLVRVAPAHSLEWYLHTNPSGTYTLARVVSAHRSCINFLGSILSFPKIGIKTIRLSFRLAI